MGGLVCLILCFFVAYFLVSLLVCLFALFACLLFFSGCCFACLFDSFWFGLAVSLNAFLFVVAGGSLPKQAIALVV